MGYYCYNFFVISRQRHFKGTERYNPLEQIISQLATPATESSSACETGGSDCCELLTANQKDQSQKPVLQSRQLFRFCLVFFGRRWTMRSLRDVFLSKLHLSSNFGQVIGRFHLLQTLIRCPRFSNRTETSINKSVYVKIPYFVYT